MDRWIVFVQSPDECLSAFSQTDHRQHRLSAPLSVVGALDGFSDFSVREITLVGFQ